jgi:membrane protein DedA with SNARE-associated domain
MNYFKFLFYTAIGAGSWNLILMLIWYVAGENRELIAEYTGRALLIVIFLVILIIGIYYKKNKKTHT